MRSRALAALLVAGLVVVAVTSSLSSPVNPTGLPGALANPAGVESSALYCTGLSDATGATQGAVVLLNTTDSTRDAHVTVVSDTGRLAEEPLTLAAHDSVSVEPDRLAAGHLFGVSVVVAGGGVVADEVAGSMSSAVPCASDAVTSWYGSGFDTTVGSTATLSFYNPTATPAVVNVTAYTAHGFVAPAPYQGLPVGAHAEVAVNIGSAIVNSANVGVRVNVVRGALVVTGVEDSLSVGSLDGGAAAATAQSWFPRVTTVSHAVAQVRVANPGSLAVSVTLRVSLGGFSVPALTLTVGAYSSAVESITPNSSIPAAGFASVGLTSSAPVVASLATGTGAGVALTPAAAPGNALLVGGVVAPTLATLTNTSSRVVSVTFDHAFNLSGCTSGAGSSLASGVARVAPGATVDVLSVYPGLTSLACSAVVVRASRPSVIVTQALASEPEGVALVSALDGG